MKLPSLTIRMRLTLLYGSIILLAGCVMIVIFYVIFRQVLPTDAVKDAVKTAKSRAIDGKLTVRLPSGRLLDHQDLVALRKSWARDRAHALDLLAIACLCALAVIALASLVLGWIVAGRMLRPINHITATARRVADRSLHERIGLDGPRDELKDLADTFDAMLERLDASFDSQRRFVANASHELRTPLATNRTTLEVALAHNEVTPPIRDAIETVLSMNSRNERMIEGLLTLARSDSQAIERAPVDLSDIAAEAVEQTAAEAAAAGVTVEAMPEPALAEGDAVLLERLALNLVRNGIRHNNSAGWVMVITGTIRDEVELIVTNSGPLVPDIDEIFEPFRHARTSDGVGLGLSIVASVVRTHRGTLVAQPRPDGGLTVRVRLPARVLEPTPA
jgi:signal transduction histidine kinase